MTLGLIACSSTPVDAPKKEEPTRSATGLFKAIDESSVKARIMGACSSSRMQLQATQNEIICASNPIDPQRERMIRILINDEWASQYRDAVKFILTSEAGEVRVSAQPLAQYMVPVSVLSGPQMRSRNLLDDASYNTAQRLLKTAGATDHVTTK